MIQSMVPYLKHPKALKWTTGGTMQFDNCSAENGGALSVHGGLQQSGEGCSFLHSWAMLSHSEPPPRKWRELFNVITPRWGQVFQTSVPIPRINHFAIFAHVSYNATCWGWANSHPMTELIHVDPIIRHRFKSSRWNLILWRLLSKEMGRSNSPSGGSSAFRPPKKARVHLQTTLVRVNTCHEFSRFRTHGLIMFDHFFRLWLPSTVYTVWNYKWSRQAEPFSILFEVRPNMFSTLSCHRWLCQRSRLHSFGRRWSIPEGRQKTTAVRCCQAVANYIKRGWKVQQKELQDVIEWIECKKMIKIDVWGAHCGLDRWFYVRVQLLIISRRLEMIRDGSSFVISTFVIFLAYWSYWSYLRDTTEVLKSGCNSGREVQWWPRALCSLGVSWILKVAVHQLKLEYSTCSRTSIRGTAAESPCQSDERWWAMSSEGPDLTPKFGTLMVAFELRQLRAFIMLHMLLASLKTSQKTCFGHLWSKEQQRYDANLGVPFQCQIAACNCSGQQETCPSRVALQQPVVVVQS